MNFGIHLLLFSLIILQNPNLVTVNMKHTLQMTLMILLDSSELMIYLLFHWLVIDRIKDVCSNTIKEYITVHVNFMLQYWSTRVVRSHRH